MTVTEIHPAVEALTCDRDTYELPDGRVLRLRIEADHMSILDEQGEGVWCGRIEWGTNDPDTGYSRRPHDFTGAAEKIYSDRFDVLWWEVPADLRSPDMAESKAATRGVIRDIIDFGYKSIGVELCEGTDAYGKLIVRDCAWIGGVEPMTDAAEFTDELIHEVLHND